LTELLHTVGSWKMSPMFEQAYLDIAGDLLIEVMEA
jgi:hypothetical protein